MVIRAWRIAGLCVTGLAVLLGTTFLWSRASELAVDRETQRQSYDHAVTRVELDLDDGAIRLRAGPVVVEADSGDVDLRFAAPPASLETTTRAGNVDVTLPGTDAYRVTVETASGDSDIGVRQNSTAPRAIAVRTTRGDVNIRY